MIDAVDAAKIIPPSLADVGVLLATSIAAALMLGGYSASVVAVDGTWERAGALLAWTSVALPGSLWLARWFLKSSADGWLSARRRRFEALDPQIGALCDVDRGIDRIREQAAKQLECMPSDAWESEEARASSIADANARHEEVQRLAARFAKIREELPAAFAKYPVPPVPGHGRILAATALLTVGTLAVAPFVRPVPVRDLTFNAGSKADQTEWRAVANALGTHGAAAAKACKAPPYLQLSVAVDEAGRARETRLLNYDYEPTRACMHTELSRQTFPRTGSDTVRVAVTLSK